MMNPQRKSTLKFEKMGDSMGVFDAQSQQSYMLNATSALVFQHCDGQTSPAQMTTLLQQKFNLRQMQAEQVMGMALSELEASNLLQDAVASTTPAPQPLFSRRQMLGKMAIAGLAAALIPMAVPIVVEKAPSALQLKAGGAADKMLAKLRAKEALAQAATKPPSA